MKKTLQAFLLGTALVLSGCGKAREQRVKDFTEQETKDYQGWVEKEFNDGMFDATNGKYPHAFVVNPASYPAERRMHYRVSSEVVATFQFRDLDVIKVKHQGVTIRHFPSQKLPQGFRQDVYPIMHTIDDPSCIEVIERRNK